TQDHFNWYLSVLDLESEVGGIIYLYNFFNGANSWENDCLKMEIEPLLATFQNEQIDNKINYMIDCSISIQNQIIETGRFTNPPIYRTNINDNQELIDVISEIKLTY
ncbi:MAG: hypothetical protein H0U73_02730, partial [Tatlockia sp.]|nr:hypothetical protein [Tatlockia sp.]